MSGNQVIDPLDARIANRSVSVLDTGEDFKKPKRKLDDGAVLQQDPPEPSPSIDRLDIVWSAFGQHDASQDTLEKPLAGLIRPFPIGLTTCGDAGLGFNPGCQIIVTDRAGHGLKTQMKKEIGRLNLARCAFAETGLESQLPNLISIQPSTSQ